MGNYWLRGCEKSLTAALGSKFKLYKGYLTNCRSTGGFDEIRGIVIHHDADNTSGEDDWVLRYEYETAIDGPIGNFHVQRDGDVWFGAAGASNHAGKGGPVPTSRGTVPLNAGNKYLIGIEASNNGVGEVWSKALMESYFVLVTTLCKYFKFDPLRDIYGHWTWCEPSCPGRKIDPRGPTPSYPKVGGASGLNKWNIDEFRKEVKARLVTSPTPPTPTPPEDDVDWTPSAQVVNSINQAPPVASTLRGENNDWAVISLLKAFQTKMGLKVTGTYNQATGDAINTQI